MKNEYFIIITFFLVICMFRNVAKSRIPVKESFFWMFGSLAALFLSIFPTSINSLAKLFGITYAPSLFFVICIVFLLFMNFRNSKRIAEQQEKISELGQQIALLKEKSAKKK